MTLKDKTSYRPFSITLVINLVAVENDSPTNIVFVYGFENEKIKLVIKMVYALFVLALQP